MVLMVILNSGSRSITVETENDAQASPRYHLALILVEMIP